MTILGTSYLWIVRFCSSPGFCYPLTTHIPQLSKRLFLSILELTLTFEGEFSYLETTLIIISEHSEPRVTFVSMVLGIVKEDVWWLQGGNSLPPKGCIFMGANLLLRAQELRESKS